LVTPDAWMQGNHKPVNKGEPVRSCERLAVLGCRICGLRKYLFLDPAGKKLEGPRPPPQPAHQKGPETSLAQEQEAVLVMASRGRPLDAHPGRE
jgi:hypothetical protein